MNIVDFLHDLTTTIDRYDLNFDAFSYGQLQSKQWIIYELKRMKINLGTIFNLCGWYGLLPAMIFNARLPVYAIRSFDIDESCCPIADQMNKTYLKNNWKFKAVTQDINDIDFNNHTWEGWSNISKKFIKVTEKPDTIINTSCEHTDDEWFYKIPSGLFVILQSTDFHDGDGHVNCCDYKTFIDRYHLTTDYFYGKREFEKYNRFMKIGIK